MKPSTQYILLIATGALATFLSYKYFRKKFSEKKEADVKEACEKEMATMRFPSRGFVSPQSQAKFWLEGCIARKGAPRAIGHGAPNQDILAAIKENKVKI